MIAVALALVLGIAAVALLVGPPTAAQGHAVPIEGSRQHVDQGSDMPYLNRPPPSGDHYDSAPKSPRYRVTKMAVVPWSDMDQAVTTAAWDWIDGMDEPDVQRILAFYREHVDRGPEDAL